MELELGLKITHNRDDITSFTELRVAKNHAGPLFLSRETETKFSLIGYLSGFRKENIDIKISEDGDQITISGRKPVQELVLIGLVMHKKEVELRAFSKAFRIPHGVILDKIKAKFNEQDLTLTITLPKSVKGFRGVGIEEVKEEEVDKGRGDEEATEGECREPGMKVEEIDQAVPKEMSIREAEATRAVALDLSRKEKDGEAAKEDGMEAEIRTNEETAQVKEQAIRQGQFEEVEKVADHRSRVSDNSKELIREKSAETNIKSMEESEKFVEQKVDAGGIVPERVGDTTLQEKPEPEDQNELEEATLEKSERNELLQAFKDQETKQPETSNQSSSQANLEHDAEENHPVRAEIAQESVKMETETHAQEPSMPGPDQEKKLADESRNDEAQEINEATGGDIVQELEMVEEQKQKDLVEGARNGKNSVSRGTKLFPPLVAGSAILVSIIVFVISWIRAKKR